MIFEEITSHAIETLHKNQECFVAQWILQNPNKNLKDYVLCYQPDYVFGELKFWIQHKDNL